MRQSINAGPQSHRSRDAWSRRALHTLSRGLPRALPRALARLLAAAAVLLAAASCAGAGAGAGAEGGLRVVATTAILADFTSRVAGPDASVVALVPAGADVHSFEPSTQAARDIAGADVVIVNGYALEGALLDVVAENRKDSARIVVATEGIEPLASDEPNQPPAGDAASLPPLARAQGDPHMWLDPALAARYVENITSALAEADPGHAAGYRERGEAAASALRALDAEVRATLEVIPEARRQIVVFHDAFGYFAKAYGFRLSAGLLSSHGGREPSAAEVADIVALVRDEGIPAVFREPQFGSGLLDAVARETGVRVLDLYSDAYGGSVAGYEAMMRANARALVEGLAPDPGR